MPASARPAFGRPEAGLRPAHLGPQTSGLVPSEASREKAQDSLNDIPNGPILKGFVTILLFHVCQAIYCSSLLRSQVSFQLSLRARYTEHRNTTLSWLACCPKLGSKCVSGNN